MVLFCTCRFLRELYTHTHTYIYTHERMSKCCRRPVREVKTEAPTREMCVTRGAKGGVVRMFGILRATSSRSPEIASPDTFILLLVCVLCARV